MISVGCILLVYNSKYYKHLSPHVSTDPLFWWIMNPALKLVLGLKYTFAHLLISF